MTIYNGVLSCRSNGLKAFVAHAPRKFHILCLLGLLSLPADILAQCYGPCPKPNPPATPSVTPAYSTDGSFQLSVSNPLASYGYVKWSTGQNSYPGPSATLPVSGKTTGVYTYGARVCYVQDNVCSDSSPYRSVYVLRTPGNPTLSASAPVCGSVQVNWSPTTNYPAVASPVHTKRYDFQESLNGAITYSNTNASSTSWSRAYPAENATYIYQVRGDYVWNGYTSNKSGWVSASVTVPQCTPGQPGQPNLTLNQNTVQVSWSAPLAGLVESYRLQRRQRLPNGVWSDWSIITNVVSPYSDTNRPWGYEYEYQIRGENDEAVGNQIGPWSLSRSVYVPPVNTPEPPGLVGGGNSLGSALGANFNGIVPGAFEVTDSGAALYQVPVDVVPGTAGMIPKLSLVYNSQSQNSLLGVGWNLRGLSKIYRCSANSAQDGLVDGVDFDSNDRFCLDDQKLVTVSGAYGSSGTEYRTEIDTFRKIISNGNINGFPASFTVWTKDGKILEYGSSTDSRIEAQGKTHVLIWALTKVSDRSGNYYKILYQEDNAQGDYRPLRIDYTGNDNTGLSFYNSVRFEYADRSDISVRYVAGSKITTAKRLTNIKTYAGEALVYDYRLQYGYAPVNGRSRLQSISKCTAYNECALSTTVGWSNSIGSFAGVQKSFTNGTTGNKYKRSWVVDADGDGKQDLLRRTVKVTGTWYLCIGTCVEHEYGDITYALYEYDGNTLVKTGQKVYTSVQVATAGWETVGDVDGDGLDELVVSAVSYPNDTEFDWEEYCRVYNLDSVDSAGNITSNVVENNYEICMGNSQNRVGDFNGDNIDDIFELNSFSSSGNSYFPAHLGQALPAGSPLETYSTIPASIWSTDWLGWQSVRSPDINGDGLDDLMLRDGSTWSVYYSHGNPAAGLFMPKQTTSVTAPSDTAKFLIIDVNADGLKDLLWLEGTNWQLQYNTGRPDSSSGEAIFTSKITLSQPGLGSSEVPVMEDFNGDGLIDLAVKNGSNWKLHFGNGSGFGNAVTTSIPSLNNPDYEYSAIDANGDGAAEIVGEWQYVAPVSGNIVAPDRVVSITDGVGKSISVAYKPLSNTSVYTKLPTSGASSNYPLSDIQDARYVVSSVAVSDGTGSTNTKNYHYRNLKADLSGRGILGFERVEISDLASGFKTINHYRQDFPYLGLLSKTEKRLLANQTLVSKQEFSYGSTGVEFIYPYVSQRIDYIYEVQDGRELTRTTVSRQCDSFGNFPVESVVLNDYENNHVYTTNITREYENNSTNWLIGKLKRITISRALDGQTDSNSVQTAVFSYGPNGLLGSSTREPGAGTPLELTTSLEYDAFGNLVAEKLSGPGITLRTVKAITYDTRGQFPLTVKNALQHTHTFSYEPRHGLPLVASDPNGLAVTHEYDNFGRLRREIRPGGLETVVEHRLEESNQLLNAAYYTEIRQTGRGAARVFYDILGREVRQQNLGFDGGIVQKDSEYDSTGRLKRASEPYYVGDPIHWNIPEYDNIHRLSGISSADPTRNISIDYNGLTTITTDAAGHDSTSVRNALGQTVTSIDSMGIETHYVHDASGNPLRVIKAAGTAKENTLVNTYDKLGRVLTILDPDGGLVRYSYNALGHLMEQENPVQRASGQKTYFQYDLLGRITARTEPEGTTNWVYDYTANGNLGIGRLYTETQGTFVRRYSYQSSHYGQLSSVNTSIGNESFAFGYSYDANGNLERITYPASPGYPSGLQVLYQYTPRGDLERVVNAQSENIYYQAVARDASGRPTNQYLGDDSLTFYQYAQSSSRIESIISGNDAQEIQQFSYSYDALGNLLTRTDNIQTLSESFTYDALNRLKKSTVGSAVVQINYDPLGNIVFKSDVGAYSYTGCNAGPHAACNIAGASYSYDLNGNMLSGGNKTLEWATYNKPIEISSGPNNTVFDYGPDRNRYRQVTSNGVSTITTDYINGLYERETAQQGAAISVMHRHYIQAGGQVLAIVTTKAGIPEQVKYLHKDPLGSVAAVTNNDGQVVERMSYDAWGRRRNPGSWMPMSIVATEKRGYTGHEHLDNVSLIHMNGRVYDPLSARFTSPDPIVHAPAYSQDWNRYSYAWNNPLRFTDPSGFQEIEEVVVTGTPLVFTVPGFGIFNVAYGGSDGHWLFASRLSFVENGLDAMLGGSPEDGYVPATNPDATVGQSSDADDEPGIPTRLTSIGFGDCGGRTCAELSFTASPSGNQVSSVNWAYWASAGVNAAGLVSGIGENSLLSSRTGLYDSWKGTNGRWYPGTWNGTSLSGYKADLFSKVDLLKTTGAGLFAVGTVFSTYQLGNNALDGNIGGVAKSSADIAIGYIGAFGGWPGLISAGSYYVIDYTVGIETFSGPITEGLCRIDSKCLP